ncbi:olfactomedin-4 [Synchiropus splendidus]|uniref:olfactomedin-4 n=1 Tax=Synchiropus splendidus TaxID=270530 RepID=UPI00237D3B63|nr:olfactomedin-4 [Synchiropus splendidus]
MSALPTLLLLLLHLGSSRSSSAQPAEGAAVRVIGHQRSNACQCRVNASMWLFPVTAYEATLQNAKSCQATLDSVEEKVQLSGQLLPQIQAVIHNVTARLQPFQYLNDGGLYTHLALQLLGQELSELDANIDTIHSQLKNAQTGKLRKQVAKLRQDVDRMQINDIVNIKTVKEKMRSLRNRAESCKSIPKDFRVQTQRCVKGLLSNISEPVVTKVSPFGKSLVAGSWGKQAMQDSPLESSSYWVQPLTSSNIWGNTVRVYPTLADFLTSTKHNDYNFAPSNSHPDANEGPNAVLYGGALYYHCYRSNKVCRYDLATKAVVRVTLPGIEVGYGNKFPYCYYDCRDNSDVDLEVDESGLWALYATAGNHGNLVMSRLEWHGKEKTLNVTHTWETSLFKKSVSNAFMACGVLYATRYQSKVSEEVFYAFDTASGRDDNTLSLRMEKVSNGIASVSYNPTDRRLYMYNDGYLLAYQTK